MGIRRCERPAGPTTEKLAAGHGLCREIRAGYLGPARRPLSTTTSVRLVGVWSSGQRSEWFGAVGGPSSGVTILVQIL